jgi:UDP-N-acetyl-D-glucosamine dehydrogenase
MYDLPKVCIQGLGFVGAAMATAVAKACDAQGSPIYQVVGVDLDTPEGRRRVESIGSGKFPFPTSDTLLEQSLAEAVSRGNLTATTDESAYDLADVVVIDVALDIPFRDKEPDLDLRVLEYAVRKVASRIPENSLILVETTVPPGTCETVVMPILWEELEQRGLICESVNLAHSYERVMPGRDYLNSIVRFWRVYAGATPEAADVCEAFLSNIIDVDEFPLTRLSSMTASETAKVMENTYRAANIAFIDEWTKYAEVANVDLFEIIDAIRVRPTHSNIRFPGLGVGGYCLTKDPAFTPAATRQLLDIPGLDFPFSNLTLEVNIAMPLHCAKKLTGLLGGSCNDKQVLLLGVSYRQDVGDTRYSPVETLAQALIKGGAKVSAFDPFVAYWPEMKWSLPEQLPEAKSFDAVVITTPHRHFRELDLLAWLGNARLVVLDAVNVLLKSQRDRCRSVGVRIESIGRGDGL